MYQSSFSKTSSLILRNILIFCDSTLSHKHSAATRRCSSLGSSLYKAKAIGTCGGTRPRLEITNSMSDGVRPSPHPCLAKAASLKSRPPIFSLPFQTAFETRFRSDQVQFVRVRTSLPQASRRPRVPLPVVHSMMRLQNQQSRLLLSI
jgi:hypothetical protein